jgi:hypothetical protein
MLVDPHGEGGGDAHTLQEDHDLLDGLLLLPGGSDQPGALGTELGHFDQPLGLFLDHVQGGDTEVVDDPLGEPRSDPLDQPRAEVAADALHGGRQHGGVILDGELPAVLGVRSPASVQPQ